MYTPDSRTFEPLQCGNLSKNKTCGHTCNYEFLQGNNRPGCYFLGGGDIPKIPFCPALFGNHTPQNQR